MARRVKPRSPPESSYTLREEQETMLGLPTKAPEQLPEEALLAKIAPEARLQRIVAKYRPPPVPDGQMGFGASFGAVLPGNQLDLFAPPAAAKPAATAETSPPALLLRRRGRKGA